MLGPVTLPQTEVYHLRSRHADADYRLWVATPVGGWRPLPPPPWGVLYVLDANLFFGTAVEMTRIMHQLHGELPPLLVVGIAYGTAVPAVQAELRGRDFTPTVDSGFEAMARELPGAAEPTLPADRRLGRATEFLAFLAEEVKPFVEERYAVAEGSSTLFGSSLGGLLVLHALLERPGVFDAYIAVSPAIWWDERRLLLREQELAASREDMEATLFLAVGAGEEREDLPVLAPFRMVSNLRDLADGLRARGYPSLDMTTFEAEGESHTTVVPVALTRALRYIFGSHRPRPAP